MNIGKDWKIESDTLNVILSHRKIADPNHHLTKKGGERWDEVGYYTTVKNALHELVNQRIRDTKLADLKTVVAEVDKLHKQIDGLSTQCLSNNLRQARRPSKD